MLKLNDVRNLLLKSGITPNVYIGKLDNKKQESIGVYHRKTEGSPRILLGGYQQGTYDIMPISLLLHWNKSVVETEEKAYQLFHLLLKDVVEDTKIFFMKICNPTPIDIGTDENGIYEYVIWIDIFYKRKE